MSRGKEQIHSENKVDCLLALLVLRWNLVLLLTDVLQSYLSVSGSASFSAFVLWDTVSFILPMPEVTWYKPLYKSMFLKVILCTWSYQMKMIYKQIYLTRRGHLNRHYQFGSKWTWEFYSNLIYQTITWI